MSEKQSPHFKEWLFINVLQKCGFCVAKVWFLQCKKWVLEFSSISISSVISAIKSNHWKRQVGRKPLSYILSAYQRNGCAQEGRTFWTCTQIKHTTLKSSLNKQHFFVGYHIPHWVGWGISCICKNQEPQKIPISMDKSQKCHFNI